MKTYIKNIFWKASFSWWNRILEYLITEKYEKQCYRNVLFLISAPSGGPQNFTASGLTETSVRLTWDLPARKLRNGEVTMYQITYHKLSDSINEEDLNCSDTFIDLVGLEVNTDYVFRIKAYTSKGAGPWSNRLIFRTFGLSEWFRNVI